MGAISFVPIFIFIVISFGFLGIGLYNTDVTSNNIINYGNRNFLLGCYSRCHSDIRRSDGI